MSSLLMGPSEAFFISGTRFYFPAFFHRIATFLLTLPICTSMLSTFSARTFSISFIVILNFLSDNFKFLPYLSLVLRLTLFFKLCFWLLACLSAFLLRVRHDVLGNKNQVDEPFREKFCVYLAKSWILFTVCCSGSVKGYNFLWCFCILLFGSLWKFLLK